MGFLEALGGVTILFLIGYLSIVYNDNKEKLKKRRKEFIDNCDTAAELKHKYLDSVENGQPIMSESRFWSKIDGMMNDPLHIKEVELRKKRRSDFEAKTELELRNRRKFGFKYDVQIFEIFNRDRELEYEELIHRMQKKFSEYDSTSMSNLFEKWLKNALIQKSGWDESTFVVGSTLIVGTQIDEGDLSYKKWVEENNIVFKEPIPEHQAYLDKVDDLPF